MGGGGGGDKFNISLPGTLDSVIIISALYMYFDVIIDDLTVLFADVGLYCIELFSSQKPLLIGIHNDFTSETWWQ